MKKSIMLLMCLMAVSLLSHSQSWLNSFEQAQTIARAEHKLILIDFYADWCGPCKEMDISTWPREKVKAEMSKLVATKINSDRDARLKMKYGVKVLPTIVITDSWGNMLALETGYKSEGDLTNFLSIFPQNIKELSTPLEKYSSNPKDADVNYEVAIACQKIAQRLSDAGRNLFLNQSNAYLKSSQRYYKKAKNDSALEGVELMGCYNKVLRGQVKSGIKDLRKMDIENLTDENKALAYYVMVCAYKDLEDKENAEAYLNKLQNCPENEALLKELETLFP